MRCLLLFAALFAVHTGFAQKVKFDDWKNLTTSGQLPKECLLQHSNNNLDLVKYHERYYLAFRTAPTHFASRKTVLYIISSPDLEQWTYEGEVKMGRDLREPRFAVYHDTLNLYFFSASTNIFRFDPQQVFVMRSTGRGWTESASVQLDGFVPWRVREHNDTLYLSAYYGKHLYKKNHHSDLRLFTSTTATNWQPLSKDPQIDVLSAEEGEFIFDKAGDLYSTVRLEGTGALVCKADKSNPGNWQKVKRTKYKYDSALMFDHNDEVYVVSRKNNDGEMDKVKHRKNEKQGKLRNLLRYWYTTKCTALYKLDKDSLTLNEVAVFPSTGDCSYPAISKLDNNTYVLMNYSSNIKGRKKNWFTGQMGRTYIYWTRLHFE